jgi:serine/threonine protein phosphatase 1
MAPAHVDLTAIRGASIVYAVGDVHGRDDLLARLVRDIEYDASRLGRPALAIFLGDIVNRGPGARQVVETLIAGPRRRGDFWCCLRGNHEQALLDALESDAAFAKFLQKGGAPTAQSYGVRRRDLRRDALRSAIPESHLAFLRALPLTCRVGDRLFVHAGLARGVPLERQSAHTLMNIREPFLSAPHGFPFTVVHGHTPSNGRPVVADGRICVDTGAVLTGVLTAAAFDDDGPGARFLQARLPVRGVA